MEFPSSCWGLLVSCFHRRSQKNQRKTCISTATGKKKLCDSQKVFPCQENLKKEVSQHSQGQKNFAIRKKFPLRGAPVSGVPLNSWGRPQPPRGTPETGAPLNDGALRFQFWSFVQGLHSSEVDPQTRSFPSELVGVLLLQVEPSGHIMERCPRSCSWPGRVFKVPIPRHATFSAVAPQSYSQGQKAAG